MPTVGNTFCLKWYTAATKQQKHELGNNDNSVLCPPKSQNKQHKNKLQIIFSGYCLQASMSFSYSGHRPQQCGLCYMLMWLQQQMF